MKLYLLAATALVAAPLYAQTGTTDPNGVQSTTGSAGQTGTAQSTLPPTTAGDQTTTTGTTDPSAAGQTTPSTTTDPAMQDQTTQPGTTGTTDPSMSQPGTTDPSTQGQTIQPGTADPNMSGSMSNPNGNSNSMPMGDNMAAGGSGAMMGGAGVAPQPVAAPPAADPNPPVCRSGQYDDCIQRSSSRGTSRARSRRR